MREGIENDRLLGLVRQAVRATGFDVVRYGPTHYAHLRRRAVFAKQGITLLLDVGANVGEYVREVREAGYRGRIVSFEPHRAAFAELSRAAEGDPTWSCRRLALGAREGTAALNVASNWGSSSLLSMDDRHLAAAPDSRYADAEAVEVATLDGLRGTLFGPEERLFLKADVQGFELEVLRGATETLAQVGALELEMSLLPLYDGAPLLPDVLAHLDAAGFNLLSFEHGFRDERSGQLLQIDGLFARRDAAAALPAGNANANAAKERVPA